MGEKSQLAVVMEELALSQRHMVRAEVQIESLEQQLLQKRQQVFRSLQETGREEGSVAMVVKRVISNSFSPEEVNLLAMIFEHVEGETAAHSRALFNVASHKDFSKLAKKIITMALKVRQQKQNKE